MKNEKIIISRVYKILSDVTPLKTDCGALCSAACCKGDDKTGMQLLPWEDEFMDESIFHIEENKNGKFAVCRGECDRELRPFACRIFPYFPVPVRLRSGRYVIRVMPDARAIGVCPLLRTENAEPDPKFFHSVERAGRLLLKSPKTRQWLLDVSDEIRAVAELQVKISGK